MNAFLSKLTTLVTLLLCLLVFGAVSQINAQINGACRAITNVSNSTTENFNGLSSGGTANPLITVPTGFGFVESGTNANTTYAAGTGSSNGGNTYSFGNTTTTSDRALGTLRSSALVSTIGGCIYNDGTSSISSITIQYTGEQYRIGVSTARATGNDRLDFQYSTNVNSTNVIGLDDSTFGTPTAVTALNFTAPIAAAATTTLDGNDSANRTIVSSTITVTIPVGKFFYFRYVDIDAFDNDDGLAIDDFTLTATFVPPSAASATVGGRVTEANGRGIFRARVTLIDSQGIEQTAYTNTQGYYSFPDVPGGQTYVFTVRHLRYQFAVSSFVEFIDEDNPNINFVSVGESLRPANRLSDQ